MKKLYRAFCAFTLLAMSVTVLVFVNTAYAESGDDFIYSSQSNSIWVLSKSTRKMIYVQFAKEDALWKSNQVPVPANFNLDKCVLKAVGSRGGSVFLCDKSSGMITLYQVNKDQSVRQFRVVDVGKDLK